MSMKATLICDIVTLLFIGLLHASVHFQMGIVSWSLNSGATNCVKWMCTFQILTLVFSRWCSSIGRARALHARGTGIDARHLHRLSSATCFSGPMFLSKWHFIISSWWSILYWNFSTTAEYVIGHSVSSNEVYFSVTKCDQCALDANLLHRAKMWRVSFVLSLVVCLCAHGCFFLVSKHSSIKHRSTAVELLSRRPICQNANAPEWLNYIHDFCACKTITYCMWKTSTIHTVFVCFKKFADIFASSEDRTHDLEIMRLTRCLLRYRGTSEEIISIVIKRPFWHFHRFFSCW